MRFVFGVVAVLAVPAPASAATCTYTNSYDGGTGINGACPVNDTIAGCPIHVLVPYAPGGPADIAARVVGAKLTEAWGQQVVVENRPGAGGVLATGIAAAAPGDGYTLLMGSMAHAVAPARMTAPTLCEYDRWW